MQGVYLWHQLRWNHCRLLLHLLSSFSEETLPNLSKRRSILHTGCLNNGVKLTSTCVLIIGYEHPIALIWAYGNKTWKRWYQSDIRAGWGKSSGREHVERCIIALFSFYWNPFTDSREWLWGCSIINVRWISTFHVKLGDVSNPSYHIKNSRVLVPSTLVLSTATTTWHPHRVKEDGIEGK